MGRVQRELAKRIWLTLGVLVVCRLGTFIPVPGIDPSMLADVFSGHSGGILGIYDLFTGGGFGRMSIFALEFLPYIAATFIIHLMTVISPQFKALQKTGKVGRKAIHQSIRYLTVLLCVLYSYGISVALEAGGGGAVIDPGLFFRFSTVVTLTGGTIFLMWLGEQITHRGVGDGVFLIIFSGIVANLPVAVASTVELGRIGTLAAGFVVFLIIMSVVTVAFIVFMERAERRIEVRYGKRQAGGRSVGGETSHLPLKLNTAGVMPPVFAFLILMPLSVTGLSAPGGPEWLATVATLLGRGQPGFLLIYLGLIVFLAFFYAPILYKPGETADSLQKHGGFIPTIRPGKNTAAYLNHVLMRLTTVGGTYLALVCVLPEILLARYQVPFYFSGASLLILVLVTLATTDWINLYLQSGGPPPGAYSGVMALRPGAWRSVDAQGDVGDEDRTDTAAVK